MKNRQTNKQKRKETKNKQINRSDKEKKGRHQLLSIRVVGCGFIAVGANNGHCVNPSCPPKDTNVNVKCTKIQNITYQLV